jgi:hypothetical protein
MKAAISGSIIGLHYNQATLTPVTGVGKAFISLKGAVS